MNNIFMGKGPPCYIPKFMEIGSLAPEKKMFKAFLPHTGHGSHMVL